MAAWRKSEILLYFKVDGSMEKKWDTVQGRWQHGEKWDTVILEGRWQYGEKVGYCYS
jgi:hypothetical protein